MRNICLATRRDFVRGCVLSAAFVVTKNVVARQPLLDVSNYTVNQYSADVVLLGLEETWYRICESILVVGMPQSGICATRNLPWLYQLGVKLSGRSDAHIEIDDNVSKAVVNLLKLSEFDSICCVNGGICLSLVNALVANGSRKLVENKRILLVDKDPLALRVCATIIAVIFGFPDSSNILCDCLSDGSTIGEGRFSSVLAFCTEDDDSLVRRAIDECQSAVILTSGDVNNIAYPLESKFWCGAAMTFPEPRVCTGKLSLLVIDKQHKTKEDVV